ncbi:Carbamoyl-phosphate synthase small chain [Chitinispirillum alkaliphilum]|nr:Carbamoyl-phosphate synthase small chain [Chitinispirillum alkaliphilum]
MKSVWKQQRDKSAFLALEDGSIFRGYAFGALNNCSGEVVFNTGMTGYQEVITDPSYAGQFVVMTSSEIGNTGINAADMESKQIFLNGLILHSYNEPSSWRSEIGLAEFLEANGKAGLAGVDTRALTLKIRSCGTIKGYIAVSGEISEQEAIQKAAQWVGLDGKDYASGVTCTEKWIWDQSNDLTCYWGIADTIPVSDMRLVAYDFGIKRNLLRNLKMAGFSVTVVPAQTSANDVLAMKPDGVFLSNGPADPAALGYAVENAKQLIGKVPLMGICLGHQILALAAGAKTYRLKFGHHGCNHPVKNLKTGKIEITSQNHNYAVDSSTIDTSKLELTHINLNDNTVEGLVHKSEPVLSVQYHPEACPGPRDSGYLFKSFRDLIKNA